MPIEPHQQHALGTANVQHDASPAPAARQAKSLAIEAGWILPRNPRRVAREGHLHVGVVGTIEALQRPAARHLDLRPSGFISLRIGEVGWRALGSIAEPKAPAAVQREEEGRRLARAVEGRLHVWKGNQRAATRQTRKLRQLRIFPDAPRREKRFEQCLLLLLFSRHRATRARFASLCDGPKWAFSWLQRMPSITKDR